MNHITNFADFVEQKRREDRKSREQAIVDIRLIAVRAAQNAYKRVEAGKVLQFPIKPDSVA